MPKRSQPIARKFCDCRLGSAETTAKQRLVLVLLSVLGLRLGVVRPIFRISRLGRNALVLQPAVISTNIGQRFLRRRDRINQILDLGIELITRELGLGWVLCQLANEKRRLGRTRLGIAM